MKRTLTAAVLAAALASTAGAQTLRIGLAEDPDVLDPTMARTFVGRIVFAGCATSCSTSTTSSPSCRSSPPLRMVGRRQDAADQDPPGVKFHDGESMDAEAVRFSLDRHLTAQGSFRRVEISVVQSIEAVDPSTVKLTLVAPFSPLIAALTDRAGMIVSPKAAKEPAAQFGTKPVCAGPFKFVERVAQDRIVAERFATTGTRVASTSTA
jgi:peptide/nickel transport system substrate-binding protein